MNLKPRIYHASSRKDIALFEPRAESVRDKDEGPVVFGTPDLAYASCFLVKTGDNLVEISSWGVDSQGERQWVMYLADEKRFRANDVGGAIYELPNTTFYTDPAKGLGTIEWVSKEPVAPLSGKTRLFESGLNAILDLGVQVFFLTPEEFTQAKHADDHGLAVILELQEQGRSENARLGKNVRAVV